MTDKELLELAAKAADYRISNRLTDGGLMAMSDNRPAPHKWNPLTDDGDALRLAARLDMMVDVRGAWIVVEAAGDSVCEDARHDTLAATRRAIVRAAAAIGAKL